MRLKGKIFLTGPSGLGDSLYHASVCRYLSTRCKEIVVTTKYPELFYGIKNVRCVEFSAKCPDDWQYINATYFSRRGVKGTNQFEDILIECGIKKDEFKFDIVYEKPGDIDIDTGKRRLCIIKAPDYNGWATRGELAIAIPKLEIFQKLIDMFHKYLFFVLVGQSRFDTNHFHDIDLNLIDQTTTLDLLYLVENSAIVLTRPGHLIPMAEGFGRRTFVVGSRSATKRRGSFIETIRKDKVCCWPEYVDWVMDDDREIVDKFENALHKAGVATE